MRSLLCAGALLAGFAAVPGAVAQTPLASIEDACRLIDKRLASVELKDCLDAGFQSADARSRLGQPILYRDFEPVRNEGAPVQKVLLMGGIHGDEFSSVSIVFRWIDMLKDDRFRRLHWRVVPCLNPDGLLARPATRVNAAGVDLNRNFPTPNWGSEALTYWEKRTKKDKRRYPGPQPLSEPESRWLADEIARFQPDVVVSLHAPLGVLDFDGPPPPPDRLGFLRLKQIGIYPGSLGNYAGVTLGIPVVTPELPNARSMPTGAQTSRMWADLTKWLDENIRPREESPLYLRLGEQAAGTAATGVATTR